jgi:hypothetical protein
MQKLLSYPQQEVGMLATFQGVVKEGQVRLFGTPPPDGTFVVVVAPELPSVEEQEARLRAIPLEERRKAFDEYLERARHGAAPEVDVATVSDQELVDVVHDVREGMQHDAGRS